MTKLWDAVTVGEIYVDHVFSALTHWPEPGEEIFTRNYIRELGGGAAITACGLGQLGRKTGVFGVIGEEEEAWMTRRLLDFAVDHDRLRVVPGTTGVSVCLSALGERTFFSFAGSNELLNTYLESPALATDLQQARHVHFAVPLPRIAAEKLFPALKDAGITVSLDVGCQPAWNALPGSLDTCRIVDYFLPNEREARLLTGVAEPHAMMRKLAGMGLPNSIVKLGARGAIAIEDGRIIEVPGRPVEVVDTTGAGDAFDAGLIDGILDDLPKRAIMERAAACGSLSTRNAGALEGLATREDLQQ